VIDHCLAGILISKRIGHCAPKLEGHNVRNLPYMRLALGILRMTGSLM